MKFRNPETGEVYRNILVAMDFHCDEYECEDCKMKEPVQEYRGIKNPCRAFCVEHPAEAARLMGYEVIEDEQEKQPTRASILEEAKRCVCDWKEKDYGIYDNSFETVAELWKTYIEQGCVDDGVDVFLGPKDVAMLMALLQIAHVSCGTATDENFVDLAAYTAYCGEIVGGKK